MKRMALFVAVSAAVSLAVAVTVGGASGAATPGKSGDITMSGSSGPGCWRPRRPTAGPFR